MKINISNLGVYELTVANFLGSIAAWTISVILTFPALGLIYKIATSGLFPKIMCAIIAGTLFGAALSIIQLLLVRNNVASIWRWVGLNMLFGIIYIVVTFVAGKFSVSLADKIYFHQGHINQFVLPIIVGIAGAVSGGIIALGHWFALNATNDIKRKWTASIVLSSFTILSLIAYALQFMQFAK